MKKIHIKLDYSHGPIWKDHFDIVTGEWSTGIKIIDEDTALQVLNDKAESLYSSLYSFENGFLFDEKGFESIKPALLSLIQTILMRLNEINDGSYVVNDEEVSELLRKAS